MNNYEEFIPSKIRFLKSATVEDKSTFFKTNGLIVLYSKDLMIRAVTVTPLCSPVVAGPLIEAVICGLELTVILINLMVQKGTCLQN